MFRRRIQNATILLKIEINSFVNFKSIFLRKYIDVILNFLPNIGKF